MTDKKQRAEPIEREDTIRDLDVPEAQADEVKGGLALQEATQMESRK